MPDPRIAALLAKAESLARSGLLADARTTFWEALTGDTGFTARNEFGCFLVRIEAYDEAIEQFSVLLAEARRIGDLQLLSTAYHNLAVVHRELGDHHVAAQLQQQSISAETLTGGHIAGTPCLLSNRANDAILAGNFRLANRLLLRSLALEVERGSLAGQAADWASLGIVSGLRGDVDEAVGCLWRAYRLHSRLTDMRGAGCDLMNLGQMFGQVGRWRAASRFLRRAVNRFELAQAPHSAQEARLRLEEFQRIADVSRRDPSRN